MKRIVLLCNQGMSTSALVAKMREVAEKTNWNTPSTPTVWMKPPQLPLMPMSSFLAPDPVQENEVKKLFPDKPVDAIDMSTYGMLDGKKPSSSPAN